MALFSSGSGFPDSIGSPESDSILLAHFPGMTVTNSALNADLLFAAPFFVSAVTVVDGLAFENAGTGDNGDKVRMGLYGSTTGGLPGALLSETGEITLDANRDVRIGALGAAQTLLPSLKYWIAIVGNAAITYLNAANRTSLLTDSYYTRMGVVPWNNGTPFYDGTNYQYFLYKSHTYGAMPSPFGTPNTTGNSHNCPIVGAQVQ